MNLEKNNRKQIVIITHILVWFVLFSLPYLLSAGTEFSLIRTLKHSTVPLVYYAIIFYTNYFILLDRFWFSSDKTYFFILNMAMIIMFVFIHYNIKQAFFIVNPHNPPPPFRLFLYIDMLSMIIPIVFSIGLKTYERWMTSEASNRQAANEKLLSELQHLKYQLQPHFFFNSLNNIYSLIERYPEKAKEVVHSLGKLMRYLLYETNVETVPLSKEIDFMKRYIELMQLRTSDNTTIHADFPALEGSISVAPLLFISLIENAFKHGVSATQKSDIDFKMYIHNDKIIFTTKNLYIPKDTSDKSGSGIGLNNLEKRLKLIYPEAHEFYTEIKEGIYHSTLTIDYKKSLHK